MNVTSEGKWVKGHQDNVERCKDLNWWSEANIGCDYFTKAHLQEVAEGTAGAQSGRPFLLD